MLITLIFAEREGCKLLFHLSFEYLQKRIYAIVFKDVVKRVTMNSINEIRIEAVGKVVSIVEACKQMENENTQLKRSIVDLDGKYGAEVSKNVALYNKNQELEKLASGHRTFAMKLRNELDAKNAENKSLKEEVARLKNIIEASITTSAQTTKILKRAREE